MLDGSEESFLFYSQSTIALASGKFQEHEFAHEKRDGKIEFMHTMLAIHIACMTSTLALTCEWSCVPLTMCQERAKMTTKSIKFQHVLLIKSEGNRFPTQKEGSQR